ncbi:MAG: endonuclease/exonuclease/phosphatase family protein [Candidatus Hydrogenedentes bacterium]|nr:endonuclease/exonuclease/phosphatase family protein [Candidatus Hydrogenedentota bacterium]
MERALNERPWIMRFNVVTYNVHACRGLDRRICHIRISDILRACNADIIALQELDSDRARSRKVDQPQAIADALGMHLIFYSTDGWADGKYGNAILSKYPLKLVRAANLPGAGRCEPRGAIWAEAIINNQSVHIVNTHLGLTASERATQVRALLGPEWMGAHTFSESSVLCGDFNFSPRDPLYRLLTERLRDVQMVQRARRAFPTWLGLRTIDFVLVSHAIEVHAVHVHWSLRTRIASDHMPLVASISVPNARGTTAESDIESHSKG